MKPQKGLLIIIVGIAVVIVMSIQNGLRDRVVSHDEPNLSILHFPTPPYPAPDFTLVNLAYNQVNFSDYRGSVILLMFWTTW